MSQLSFRYVSWINKEFALVKDKWWCVKKSFLFMYLHNTEICCTFAANLRVSACLHALTKTYKRYEINTRDISYRLWPK